MADDKDNLESYWGLFGVPPEPEESELLRGRRQGELRIGPKDRPLVSIDAEGKLTYGEGYQPDLAARVFWEAMANARMRMMGADVQLLFFHMQDVLLAYGDALLEGRDEDLPLTQVRRLALALARGARAAQVEDPDS